MRLHFCKSWLFVMLGGTYMFSARSVPSMFSDYGQIQNVQNYSSNPFWNPNSPYNQKLPQPVYVQGASLNSEDCMKAVYYLVSAQCIVRNNCQNTSLSDIRPEIMIDLSKLPGANYVSSCSGYIDTAFESYVKQNADMAAEFPDAPIKTPVKIQNPYKQPVPEWQQEIINRQNELQQLQKQNGAGGEDVSAEDFPSTYNDLSFSSKMQLMTDGYEPFKDKSAYIIPEWQSKDKWCAGAGKNSELCKEKKPEPTSTPTNNGEITASATIVGRRPDQIKNFKDFFGFSTAWFDINNKKWMLTSSDNYSGTMYEEFNARFKANAAFDAENPKYLQKKGDWMVILYKDKNNPTSSNAISVTVGESNCSPSQHTKPASSQEINAGGMCWCRIKNLAYCNDTTNGCKNSSELKIDPDTPYEWDYAGGVEDVNGPMTPGCMDTCPTDCIKLFLRGQKGFYYNPAQGITKQNKTTANTVATSSVETTKTETAKEEKVKSDNTQAGKIMVLVMGGSAIQINQTINLSTASDTSHLWKTAGADKLCLSDADPANKSTSILNTLITGVAKDGAYHYLDFPQTNKNYFNYFPGLLLKLKDGKTSIVEFKNGQEARKFVDSVIEAGADKAPSHAKTSQVDIWTPVYGSASRCGKLILYVIQQKDPNKMDDFKVLYLKRLYKTDYEKTNIDRFGSFIYKGTTYTNSAFYD